VTLQQIAEKSGFDRSTVSRALRDHPSLSIRPENMTLIKEIARDLEYTVDMGARGLRSSRTYSLAIVASSLQDHVHGQIIEAIINTCNERGYVVVIARAQTPADQVEVTRRMMAKNCVEGIICLEFHHQYVELTKLRGFDAPIMAVKWRAPGFENWVIFKERLGACLAMHHLFELGHRRIAHLAASHAESASRVIV
jgi:DNA-binding LacI/PurR family transcriptional regulator